MNLTSQEQARFASFIPTAFEEVTKLCNAAAGSPSLTPQQVAHIAKDGAALLEELKSLASQGTVLRKAQLTRIQEAYKVFYKRVYHEPVPAASGAAA